MDSGTPERPKGKGQAKVKGLLKKFPTSTSSFVAVI